MANTHTSASCPTCDTTFQVPVHGDEDGAYAVLELTPCQECGSLLCPCCEQFACDGCGQTFCQEHLVSVQDGTQSPLHCCSLCEGECEIVELPFAPLRCVACQEAIGIRDSVTGNGEDIWHTRCWNAAEERRRIAAEEYDDMPELPPRRAMSAANAAEVSTNTEVA
jgi:hypothetical protein